MENKKSLTLLILGSLILLLSGITAAYFVPKVTNGHVFISQGKADATDLDNLVMLTTESDSIELSSTYPMSEEMSLKNIEPYYFSVKNNSDTYKVKYEVLLSVSDTSTISDELISTNLSCALDPNKAIIDTSLSSRTYKILDGELVARETEVVPLRIWINESGTVESVLGKKWSAKLVVKYTKGETSSKIKVLSGDIQTTGSELKLASEYFYVLSNNDNVLKLIGKYGLFVGDKDTCEIENGTLEKTCITEKIDPATFNYGRQDARATGYVSMIDPSLRELSVYYGLIDNDENIDSIIKEYLSEYSTVLSNELGINVEASLPKKSELISIGCSEYECPEELNWLLGKTYYITDDEGSMISHIEYDGTFSESTNFKKYAIVPVITLNLNDLKLD